MQTNYLFHEDYFSMNYLRTQRFTQIEEKINVE